MVALSLHYDFRAPEFGAAPANIYAAAVEQCAWADGLGFTRVVISSHHGSDDNYGPSPLVAATAIAARTSAVRIAPVVALPLYHPLHVAEDVAVLDLVSGGRVDLIVAGGYVRQEFAMFGRSMSERAARMEEGVPALRRAWSGEPFEFRGATVRVTPRPLQRPGPPIIMAGDSPAAARRAARLADAYVPMTGSQSYEHYVAACAEVGRPASPVGPPQQWMFLHVTEDPDRSWDQLAPHLLHVNNSYATWMADAGTTATYVPRKDAGALRADPNYRVVTPEECIDLARRHDYLYFDPLFGGLSPDLAWESLHLTAEQVLPALTP